MKRAGGICGLFADSLFVFMIGLKKCLKSHTDTVAEFKIVNKFEN
jgi:hypothetical protein